MRTGESDSPSSWERTSAFGGGGGTGGSGGGHGAGMGAQFAMPSLTPMVRRLIYVNSAAFLVTFLLWLMPGTRGVSDALIEWGGVSPGLWIHGFPFLPLWQLVSWGFLHSVLDPTHVLFNMLFLYFLGTMLEGLIGSRRFLATYLSSILVCGVATLVVGIAAGPREVASPLVGEALSYYPTTIGASGAVFTVVVAMAALRPMTRVIFLIFPITLRTLAIIYVGLNAFSMLRELGGGASSNVAYLAHLVGAGWGYLLVRKGWIWRDPLEAYARKRAEVEARRDESDQERLDALLKRIHKQGIHTLSKRERDFLTRVSKRG